LTASGWVGWGGVYTPAVRISPGSFGGHLGLKGRWESREMVGNRSSFVLRTLRRSRSSRGNVRGPVGIRWYAHE